MKPLEPLFIILLAFSLVLPISSVFGSSIMWNQTYGGGLYDEAHAIVQLKMEAMHWEGLPILLVQDGLVFG